MQDKICLVTGATSGIGKITATSLAMLGARVVVVGRNEQKTRLVVQEIQMKTGSKSVDYLLADFSDLQQIRKLVDDYKKRYTRLDVLVNNAGAYFNARHRTEFGVEKTFLVNHLAPFLLTHLLLDTLVKSQPSRIVNVASDAHVYDQMDFNDLGFERFYFGFKAYARSKLANILFTYELSRRLGNGEVTVNALHPGYVATDIWKTDFSFMGPMIKWLTSLVALTPEEGADNSIYLASAPELVGVTGAYYIKREPAASSPVSKNEQAARRLWEISEQLVNPLVEPG